MKVTQKRLAGVVLPLFSIRSDLDWGVGEYPDFARVIPMLEAGGFSALMTLPLLEPSPGQESPYSPISAFAIDPLYIRLDDVAEFEALGGRAALDESERDAIAQARASFYVRHDLIRPLKRAWLERCYTHFVANASQARRASFEAFRQEHASWIGDYALFRSLKEVHTSSWRDWSDADLREAQPARVEKARKEHAFTIGLFEYAQWIAFGQLSEAREALRDASISIGGDEPFLVAEDSADVWAHQDLYRFDATVGAPPDPFSADGQDWGLPPYRWDRIAAADYELFVARGRHAARLFDFTRIDHVVGLYRTYHRPIDGGECYFVPHEHDAEAQVAQGEAVLHAFASGGAALIAEDLGVIPDYVRESLARLEIPGFRVLRWEQRDGHFVVPQTWPTLSVATNGTHDTETTAVWWDLLPEHERDASFAVPELARIPRDLAGSYNRYVEAAVFDAIYYSPSNLVITPIQDVFGMRDRINIPNTVGPHNWSWRLPWSLERLTDESHLTEALDRLRRLGAASDRG